jgi:hypothetical protein
MLGAHDLLRRKMPGFEGSFILDMASQIGTRASRRLIGEYVVTDADMRAGVVYDDTIAAIPRYTEKVSSDTPNKCIPLRAWYRWVWSPSAGGKVEQEMGQAKHAKRGPEWI